MDFTCFSFSKKNTLRGLHLQRKKSQAKIITVVHGKILDVVVDLRKNSKTFGKHFAIKIEDKSDFSLFIPKNFAHGFLCLSKYCAVYYKCTNYRDANSETTIKWKTYGSVSKIDLSYYVGANPDVYKDEEWVEISKECKYLPENDLKVSFLPC